MHADVTTGLRGILLGALLVASLTAHAASPKLGGPAAPLATASAPLSAEPATRLIIRYKTAVKMAGEGGVTVATERREAAMRVARTAHLAGAPLLEYIKSVSPSLHVVALPTALTPTQTQAAMQRLRDDPGVADVSIDHRMQPHLAPTDPRFGDGSQWHLLDSATVPGGINAAAAWDFSSGVGVVVAVLDTGYRPHADLATNVLPGYDFIGAEGSSTKAGQLGQPYWTANDGDGRDSDAQDPGDWVAPADVTLCTRSGDSSWHGTHVAGIVAAVGNNHLKGLGVAYGAKILPVRVLGRCGGYSSDILAGARWAAGLPVQGVPANPTPARILNLSLGHTGPCDSITQAVVDEIRARNVSIVASAGNVGSTEISTPANCRGVLAVTAHTREGDNADYANVGAGVAISAPGGGSNTVFPTPDTGIRGVLSTWNTGTKAPVADAFAEMAGTSMAAPQVAGVLALLASLRPDLSMATLEGIVTSAVRPFPADGYCATHPNFCGSGLLDAQLAVAAATAHVAPSSSGGGGGGGGCTVAPGGRADAGLVLLALCALWVLAWRRRSMPQAVRPSNAS